MELESLGVRRVLNMAENCDDELVIERWGHQGYLKVGLRDHVDQDLKEGLATAIKFIGKLICSLVCLCSIWGMFLTAIRATEKHSWRNEKKDIFTTGRSNTKSLSLLVILSHILFSFICIASSDTPIYVHCQAGKSRSVATVIGYLIQEHHWPLKKAYDHVVERRRCMSPNIGFVSQLIMLEERILGREHAGGLVSVGSDDTTGSRTTVVPWMVS